MEVDRPENRRRSGASFTIDYLLFEKGKLPNGDPQPSGWREPGQRDIATEVDPPGVSDSPDLLDKPNQSYIALISTAILSSPDKKLLLSDIYQWIMDNYPYFKNKEKSWRNSVRHNLSLNECFVKAGRSDNGKGHFWAIHPANLEDFSKGDYHRRRARRRIRRMAVNCGYCHPHPFYGLSCCPPGRFCLCCLPYAPLALATGPPHPGFPPLFLPSAWPRTFLSGGPGAAKAQVEKRHGWAAGWSRLRPQAATVWAHTNL